jgi:hypothetical protein
LEPAIAVLDDDKQAEIDETMEMLTGNCEKIGTSVMHFAASGGSCWRRSSGASPTLP